MKKYAIIDVETTGGLYNRDKVIEIAIIVTDGRIILEEYQSLLNPERSIPPEITRITGIDDMMVHDAPRFYEIAKDIVEITDGCVFVAHNVKFDYSFIKQEFATLGYPFNKKNLCTVKLTRSQVPGLKSYGLDNLIKHFGLLVKDRHRAYGDAYATYEIFSQLIGELPDDYHVNQLINQGIDATVLPKGIDIEDIHSAPEGPGIYYLSNQYDRIIYVGKAKNIKKRLFQHFRKLSRKSLNMYHRVHKMHYEETGNELTALLLELSEIKSLRPELNRSLKRSHYPYALYYDPSAPSQKASFTIKRNIKKNDARGQKLRLFGSKQAADSYIQHVISELELCKRHFDTRSKIFTCYCLGECGEFFVDHVRARDHLAEWFKNEFEEDFVILLEGRSQEEKAFVLIRDKRFGGMGYVSASMIPSNLDEWLEAVEQSFFYPEAHGLIRHYMNKNNLKIIRGI